MLKPLITLATSAVLATAAHGHQLWIEQAPGEAAMVRFGEFAENLREASPGLLDKFGQPTGVLVTRDGERPLLASKVADGFRLTAPGGGAVTAGPADSLVAEDLGYPLYKSRQGDGEISSWYRPAARHVTGFATQAPRLVLDIVPTGREGEFRITHKGQSLPKAKVTIALPSGWSRDAQSDAQGLVSFPMPWQGAYVLEASHMDRTPGERTAAAAAPAAERYDRIHHVTTLSVVKAVGLAPLPAGPAATPGK